MLWAIGLRFRYKNLPVEAFALNLVSRWDGS